MHGHFCPQGLHLNKVESLCPKDAPCIISMHSGKWFLRKSFEDLPKLFLMLPAPFFEVICIPIPQACFLPNLVEIGLVVLEKKSLKGKS